MPSETNKINYDVIYYEMLTTPSPYVPSVYNLKQNFDMIHLKLAAAELSRNLSTDAPIGKVKSLMQSFIDDNLAINSPVSKGNYTLFEDDRLSILLTNIFTKNRVYTLTITYRREVDGNVYLLCGVVDLHENCDDSYVEYTVKKLRDE